MDDTRCNCENLHCDHGDGPCPRLAAAGRVVIAIGKVCPACWERYPLRYRDAEAFAETVPTVPAGADGEPDWAAKRRAGRERRVALGFDATARLDPAAAEAQYRSMAPAERRALVTALVDETDRAAEVAAWAAIAGAPPIESAAADTAQPRACDQCGKVIRTTQHAEPSYLCPDCYKPPPKSPRCFDCGGLHDDEADCVYVKVRLAAMSCVGMLTASEEAAIRWLAITYTTGGSDGPLVPAIAGLFERAGVRYEAALLRIRAELDEINAICDASAPWWEPVPELTPGVRCRACGAHWLRSSLPRDAEGNYTRCPALACKFSGGEVTS